MWGRVNDAVIICAEHCGRRCLLSTTPPLSSSQPSSRRNLLHISSWEAPRLPPGYTMAVTFLSLLLQGLLDGMLQLPPGAVRLPRRGIGDILILHQLARDAPFTLQYCSANDIGEIKNWEALALNATIAWQAATLDCCSGDQALNRTLGSPAYGRRPQPLRRCARATPGDDIRCI